MTTLDHLKSILKNVDSDIQEELSNGSDNPWLACFNTRLSVFRLALELCDEDKLETAPIHSGIDKLRTQKNIIQAQHAWDPPDNIKRELIDKFKELLQ